MALGDRYAFHINIYVEIKDELVIDAIKGKPYKWNSVWNGLEDSAWNGM